MKSFLGRIIKTIVRVFIQITGTVSWTPPRWLASSLVALRRGARIGATWLNAKRVLRPKQFWGSISAIAVLIAAGISTYQWYQNLPKPELLKVEIVAPAATKLEKDAKPNVLRVRFSGSAAKLEEVGKAVTSGFTVIPELHGAWKWESDRELLFTPSEDWPVGQHFELDFSREFFPAHVRLADYTPSFDTEKFTAKIEATQFYEDPIDPKLKKVITTVRFNYAVDKSDFERHVAYQMRVHPVEDFKSRGVIQLGNKVVYDEFGGKAFVHSDAIAIPDDEGETLFTVEKGVRAARGGPETDQPLESRQSIPGMLNYFKVDSVSASYVKNQQYETEQVVTVSTSVGVNASELAKNLQLYRLPKDRPAFQDFPFAANHYWSSTAEIGPEVLSVGTELEPQWIATEHDFEKVRGFKISVEPNTALYVRIKKGLKSFGDYQLTKEYDTVLRISMPPREVKIMGEGALLSLSGDKGLSVLTRDVGAVQFEVSRVLPRTISQLITQTRGDFRSPQFTNYYFGFDDITARETKVVTVASAGNGKASYTAFDFTPYLGASESPRGLFNFRVDAYDTSSKSTIEGSDQRLILITDLGVIVKDSLDGKHDVFVQSIRSGQPVGEVNVQILGRNGLPVQTQKTGPDGHVVFPNISDLNREREPVVYVLEKGDDLSFIPYNREDRKLNFSRFDIGGDSSRPETSTDPTIRPLEAVLFSDRGIYRPGDEFHIGMIVRDASWRALDEGIPFEIAVTDPRGLEIATKKMRFGSNGFEEYSFQTQDTALTGSYHVTLYIMKDKYRYGELASTVLRVEEFLPDRMNIRTSFSAKHATGWVSPAELKGMVTLKNLFGLAAQNHKVNGSLYLSPAYPTFAGYSSYNFYDPFGAKKSFNESLGETMTNDSGDAEFALNLERFEKATYRATFFAQGFELEGGRSVSGSSSVLVSPLPFIVGAKADGNLQYVNKDSSRTIHLIAIDSNLAKRQASDLKLDLVEVRYVSALSQQPNGTLAYQSVKKELLKKRIDFEIPEAGVDYALPTDQPGSYLIILRDSAETELNRISFNVVGHGNLSTDLEKNAELEVKLNKKDAAPGDEIELSIVAPYVGAGLITIEKDRVYAFKWFSTTTNSSTEKIKVPSDLEGNGYINVTFVRAIDSKEVFMSPLSYGIVPFTVSRDRRVHKISVTAPEKVRPGEDFSIHYQSQQPGKIALFAVDEGILQVARYSTPDPLEYFLRKRALEVETAQILDLILPEISVLRSLSAPGGDESALLARNLNPFKRKGQKPVAFWSGIVDIDSTDREFKFRIPDYFNGTVRVMAVSVTADSIGVEGRKSIVKGAFVLSPSVPLFVAPGDLFEVSTSVSRDNEEFDPDASVRCAIDVGKGFEVISPAEQLLEIAPGQEKGCSFKLKAKPELGSNSLLFKAATSTLKASMSLDLSIRPSVPFMTNVQVGFFKKGFLSAGAVEVPVTRSMYDQHRVLEASASVVPVGIANGLVSYLRAFPHGCSEQIVSQVLPDLILQNNKEFDFSSFDFAARYQRVISILRSRQNSEGAFGFWTANSSLDPHQTIYATHFMIEAKERGNEVPAAMLRQSLEYLKTMLGDYNHDTSGFRRKAYGLYLLTRNGTITTNELNAIREGLDKYLEKTWKKDIIAAFIAATYKLLKLDDEAEKLISAIPVTAEGEYDYQHYFDPLVRNAQYLYLISKHFPERARKIDADDLAELLSEIPKGAFNTYSSAYTVLAIDAYQKVVGTPASARASIVEVMKDAERNLGVGPGAVARTDFADGADKIRFASEASHPLFYQVTETGFDKSLPTSEIKDGIEVTREYRNAKGEPVTAVALGEAIQVHLVLRSLTNQTHYNVAVIDLLPGGTEVALPLSSGANVSGTSLDLDYVDAREDRVVVYAAVGEEAQHYYYMMKATQKGDFEIPPLYAESMYDRRVRARMLGGKLKIE